MDHNRTLISFDLTRYNISFRDSYRLFPASLKELSLLFKVEFPKGEFDHSKVSLNNLHSKPIKTELIEYLDKDLISLIDVIVAATKEIFNAYKVRRTPPGLL